MAKKSDTGRNPGQSWGLSCMLSFSQRSQSCYACYYRPENNCFVYSVHFYSYFSAEGKIYNQLPCHGWKQKSSSIFKIDITQWASFSRYYERPVDIFFFFLLGSSPPQTLKSLVCLLENSSQKIQY